MCNENEATIAIIELQEIIVNTPRLLAWGAMLHIPYRAIVRLVVEIADMLPPTIHTDPLDEVTTDAIKDAIGYVYDDHPDWITSSTPIEVVEKQGRNEAIVIYEFEEMVIQAAHLIRQILGEAVVECHYVDLRQSRYIVVEVTHGM